MHRTKIIALALLGVAVSAASGCVAVPPAAESPSGPVRTPAHHARGAGPQIAQGPPVEALETVGPGPGTARRGAAPPAGHPTGGAPESGAGTASARTGVVVRPARPRAAPRIARPAQPAPRHRRGHAAHPSGATADVCALGEGYGGWRPDSPQARICHQTYGR
ncbi:hypothetical protein [Streptomyces sp. NBC_00388]|uniref:hypothetical protein n=1 Tax=Streptomyces sp. NBC_00388 TaxID=2975735 RepID=UPI002E20ABF9